MPNTSLADKLKAWQVCATAMAPQLEERLAHLGVEHTALLAVIQGIEAFLVEEELHRSNVHDTVRKRRELERQGTKLFGRIDFGLRSHHGKDSQELRQYGIDPLTPPTRRRRREEEPEPPATPPAAAGG